MKTLMSQIYHWLGSENEDEERRGKENDEYVVKRRRSSKRKASKTSGENWSPF